MSRSVVVALALVVGLRALVPPAAVAQTVAARGFEEACSPAPRSGFFDRPAAAEAGRAVDCVDHFGITAGRVPGAYAPGEAVTRGQMASFLVRTIEVASAPRPASTTDQFPDDEGSVHEDNIDALFRLGVAGGFSDGTFRPLLPVSRQQMASFVARQLEASLGRSLAEPVVDHFGDDEGSVHERRIDQLADLGVVVGRGTSRFAPAEAVTRGQMALFLSRGLDHLTEDADVALRRIGLDDALTSPELLAASLGPTSGATTTVHFDFDVELSGDPVAGSFHLYSTSAEQHRATSASIDSGDGRRVLAQFERSAAAQATAAGVEAGAVTGPQGQPSPEGGAALRARSLVSGSTNAPDLASVTRLGAQAVDFTFDEPAEIVDPSGYVLVLDDGTLQRSTAATGSGDTTHTVSFPSLTGEDAIRARRGYVEAATVRDTTALGVPNPQQSVDTAGTGDLPGRPDLTAVQPDAAVDIVRYVFDGPIDLLGGTVRAYLPTGAEVATTAVRPDADDVAAVIASFPAGSLAAGVAGASVDGGLVQARDTGMLGAVDEVGLPASFDAGRTAAPDLVLVGRTANPATSTSGPTRSVVFVFDAPVSVSQSNGFLAYGADGRPVRLSGCTLGGGPVRVECTAEATVDPVGYEVVNGAARVAVVRAAVTDRSRSYPSYESSAVI